MTPSISRFDVVRFGPPADAHGHVFERGCFKGKDHVPVTVDFDYSRIVGEATLHDDGSADVRFAPGFAMPDVHEISIGYRVSRQRFEGDHIAIEDAEVVCLGVISDQRAIK